MPALTLSVLGDMAMAVAMPVVHKRRRPDIPTLTSVNDVRKLLHSSNARRYPPYVLAVLTAYARHSGLVGKRARSILETELGILESEFPEFAAEFRAVSKVRGLARDPSLDDVDMRQSTCPCPRHRGAARQSRRGGGRTPPPLYASDDPDPEATRVLVAEIVRVAGVSSSVSAAAADAEQALRGMEPVWTVKQERRRTWLW